MSKKVIVISMMVLLTSLFLFGSKKEDMWRKAITEKNLELRLQYLKDYEAEFGNKKDKFHKFLYMNLADTAFQLTKYDEAIQYGEKALTFQDLNASNKLRLYLSLANSYNITKKDIEKAYHYAGMIVDLSKELISKHEASEQDPEKKKKYIINYKTFYIAPALRIQSQILYSKGKDIPATLKEAAQKACEAFETDKSKRSSDMVFSFAVSLYRNNLTNESIEALELILDKEKPEYKYSYMLANLYNRKKNKTKAAMYFEMAYNVDRKAKLAMKIAQLVYKENIDKGIQYFAEAYVLSKSNKESDAFKYLKHLYFNQKAKNKPPAEQEKGFRTIINTARKRLGMKPLEDPAPGPEQENTETQTQT
jgi:tetratricopeptide (TPR) repeat protein